MSKRLDSLVRIRHCHFPQPVELGTDIPVCLYIRLHHLPRLPCCTLVTPLRQGAWSGLILTTYQHMADELSTGYTENTITKLPSAPRSTGKDNLRLISHTCFLWICLSPFREHCSSSQTYTYKSCPPKIGKALKGKFKNYQQSWKCQNTALFMNNMNVYEVRIPINVTIKICRGWTVKKRFPPQLGN